MKKILVTGENSYIGTSFVDYMSQYSEEYLVETISVRGNEWKEKDFSKYDVIYHVAGIAHQKETKENKQLYYDVNYTLTKEVAKKAKKEGVRQFIFLSSMSVYGISNGKITKVSIPSPKSAYGDSKYKAEEYLIKIENQKFKISLVRPPMVYGKNSKGNYGTLSYFSKKISIFPKVSNKRSMIFINNLSYSIKKIIEEQKYGVICPQNKDAVCTSNLVYQIGKVHSKKIFLSSLLGGAVKIILKVKIINKIFGDLYYDFDDVKSMPFTFEESINLTEVE